MDHRHTSASAIKNQVPLDQLVASIPGVLFQIVLRSRRSIEFTYLSPRAEQLLGFAVEKIMADPQIFLSLVLKADKKRCYSLLRHSATSLSPCQFTFRIHAGAEIRWITCHCIPEKDSEGWIRWSGQFLDCSQQQRDQQQLERSRTLLQAAQNQARLGLWDYELESGKIQWSREVFEIHGVALEQGEPDLAGLANLYHPEDFPLLADAVRRAIETGEGYRLDLRIVHAATGEIRHVSATGGSLRNPFNNAPELLYGTLFDITHRKQLEATLSAARDAAESNARAKSNFLASMSHELRTPLNGIVGMTSLLRATELDSRQAAHCETIHQSAEALVAVVNDILDWSRIESGQMQLEQIPFDLEHLLRGVLNILRPQAESKSIDLRLLPCGTSLPSVIGDPIRLRQVLLNLGANAIKFTLKGSVAFRISRVQMSGTNLSLRFEIIDTGIGIKPEQMSRLFQRFSQADASTTRRFGGSGLGLAISKSLVDLMGGDIGVESEFGKGSTFWIELNLPIAATQHSKLRAPDNSVVHGSKPLHILIAEDNPVNQQLASMVLEQAGHTYEICPNGLIALDCALTHPFDLVLMDCQMPEMDGFEATRRIRESIHRPLPIIGLTADVLTEDRGNCLASGMSDYLAKPYRAEQLLTIINKWANLSS